MSAENQILADKLKRRIEMLISLYEKAASENESLRVENSKLRTKLDECNIKLKESEEKIDRIVLAGAFKTSTGDVREARQKIARIVREIEKCIALLNN